MRPLRHPAILLVLCILGAAAQAQAATELQLLGGRFHVSAGWSTSTGATGTGEGIAFSPETGLFWFFTPAKLELVVKVIDACVPPFNRIWFFASGLTNTEVTITVVDTWSGQSKTYHHAGGALFAPLADTGAFDTCGFSAPPCGQGIRSDIDASPRPDAPAENLALMIGNGVAAEQALYERLSADLAAIRAAEPAVANVYFDNIWWSTQELYLILTPEAYAAVQAGTYHEWDCLNTWFRGEVAHIDPSSPYGLLHFDGMLHPYRIGFDYLRLPGVTHIEPNGYSYPSAGPPPRPGLCAIADGAAFEYFIEGSVWRFFRVANPGAAPVAMGTWNGAEPAPSWRPHLDACYARLDESAYPPQ